MIGNLLKACWMVLTLRCDAADRIRCVSRDGPTTRAERLAEHVHRGLCKSCRIAERELKRVDEGLARVRHSADGDPARDVLAQDPPPGFEQRLAASLARRGV